MFANDNIKAFTKFGPFQGEPRTAIKNSDSYWEVRFVLVQLYFRYIKSRCYYLFIVQQA